MRVHKKIVFYLDLNQFSNIGPCKQQVRESGSQLKGSRLSRICSRCQCFGLSASVSEPKTEGMRQKIGFRIWGYVGVT